MSHVPTMLKSDRSVFENKLPVGDNVALGLVNQVISIMHAHTRARAQHAARTQTKPIRLTPTAYSIRGYKTTKSKDDTDIRSNALFENTETYL